MNADVKDLTNITPDDYDNLSWCRHKPLWNRGFIVNSEFKLVDSDGNTHVGNSGDWVMFDAQGKKHVIPKELFDTYWEIGSPADNIEWNSFPQSWPEPGKYIVKLRDGSILEADFYITQRLLAKESKWTPCDKTQVIAWRNNMRN